MRNVLFPPGVGIASRGLSDSGLDANDR
jgi:hypothetical protein